MTGNLRAAFEPSRATAAQHDASCLAAAERDASALATRDTSCGPEPDASARAAGDASQGTGGTRRICAWCRGPIPARARRDAVCCSQRCRQARHRFLRTVGRAAVAAGRPLRLAYADPPYPGNARLYRGHRDYAGEVDHAALIRRLDPYDGWALSTSAAALPAVLAVCPPGVRVAAWHRGERPTASWRPPFITVHRGAPGDIRTADIDRPLPTLAAGGNHLGLAVPPFVVMLRRCADATAIIEPLSGVTAGGNHHALISPPEMAMIMRGETQTDDRGFSPPREPIRTVTASGSQFLIRWEHLAHLLIPYYRTGVARPVSEPAGTLPATDRYALASPAIDVDDVLFRMLEPHEIGAAMAFFRDYQVVGNKREKVRQFGNAVTPPVAEVLISALVEAITGEPVETAA